jgi:hypothetical protein
LRRRWNCNQQAGREQRAERFGHVEPPSAARLVVSAQYHAFRGGLVWGHSLDRATAATLECCLRALSGLPGA